MSEDANQSGKSEQKSGDAGTKAEEKKVNVVALNFEAREAILAKSQESAVPPEEGTPNTDEGKSESEKSDEGKSEVGALQTESVESEGKKSSVESQNKNEKPKGNLEKALQEEREKRKKATLESRQLREKNDADMAALRKELDELKRTKQNESVNEGDDSDPEKQALKRELQQERAKRDVEEKQKQIESQQNLQKAYEEKVNKVHGELKEAGYLGFKFFQTQTREAILKRYNEGEFVDQDLNDPAIWKKVYTEDVYKLVKDEFPASNEKERLEKKLEAKKKAAAIPNPGPAPKNDAGEEKPAPTLEEMNKAYIKQRQEASRKVGA